MFTLGEFFTDPVLRGPTIGSMFMGLSCALVGAIAFLQRRSLVGETLSHATFPGVAIGVILAGLFSFGQGETLVAICATVAALLGLVAVNYLVKKMRIQGDAALCLILSLFLGFGLLIASQLQISHPQWYRKIHLFLYGQAATMGDEHIKVYAYFGIGALLFILFFFRRIQIATFDTFYAHTTLGSYRLLSLFFSLLLITVIVVGVRSVGVVLMSGMLVAPPIAARKLTNRLSLLFLFSALVGVASAFLGNYLSVQIPKWSHLPLSLATGPMMVLCAASFALLSLFFSPSQGLVLRQYRKWRFQVRCLRENLLKSLWKGIPLQSIQRYYRLPQWKLSLHLASLRQGGYLEGDHLSHKGEERAIELVRVHRLWEVYLNTQLGLEGSAIHDSAGEVEHLISAEEERMLTELLGDPEYDPHNQPIPKLKGGESDA